MLRNLEVVDGTPQIYMCEPIPHHLDKEAYYRFIAVALLKTLDQMEHDVRQVVFSGYRVSQPKEDAFEEDPSSYSDVHDNLKTHVRRMQRREETGHYLTKPHSKTRDRKILGLLRQIAQLEGRPTYFFGTADNLTSGDEGINPIVYAEEYPGDSVIGVYDLEALRELGLIERSTECEVTANPEEVEQAKLFDFFLCFAEPIAD